MSVLTPQHAGYDAEQVDGHRRTSARTARPRGPGDPRAHLLLRLPGVAEPAGLRRDGAADAGRQAFESLLHRRFDLGQPATAGWVATERSPWGPELGVEYPVPDVDELLAAQTAAIPAWRDAGPRRPRRAVRRDARAHQRGQLRDRERRDAHLGAGVRHGLPGRRPARAGPRARGRRLRLRGAGPLPGGGRLGEAAGQARADPHGQDLHRRPAWHRPRHRLQHLPDLELLSRPLRRPRHRQRRPGQAAPARRPAAGDHRADRPRGARRARLRPRPGLPGRRARPGGAARRGARPPARRSASSTTPARPPSGTGSRPTPGRRGCSPRRPASTPSSSTRPTTTAGCSPTSRSRSSLQRPDVHDPAEPLRPPRRASPRTPGTCPSSSWAGPGHGGRRPPGRGRQGRRLLGAVVNDDVLARLEARARARLGRRRRPARCTRRRTPTRGSGRRRSSASTPRTRRSTGSECFGPVAFLVTTASTAQSVELCPPHRRRPRRDHGVRLQHRPGRARRVRERRSTSASPCRRT